MISLNCLAFNNWKRSVWQRRSFVCFPQLRQWHISRKESFRDFKANQPAFLHWNFDKFAGAWIDRHRTAKQRFDVFWHISVQRCERAAVASLIRFPNKIWMMKLQCWLDLRFCVSYIWTFKYLLRWNKSNSKKQKINANVSVTGNFLWIFVKYFNDGSVHVTYSGT